MFLDVIPALPLKLRYNTRQEAKAKSQGGYHANHRYLFGRTDPQNQFNFEKVVGEEKKFIAIIEGNSLIIKKPHSLSDFSAEPDEDFMSMEEINKEIHKARKEN